MGRLEKKTSGYRIICHTSKLWLQLVTKILLSFYRSLKERSQMQSDIPKYMFNWFSYVMWSDSLPLKPASTRQATSEHKCIAHSRMGVGRWKNNRHVCCVWRCINRICLTTGPMSVYNSRDAIFPSESAFHTDTFSIIRRHGSKRCHSICLPLLSPHLLSICTQ